MKDTEFKAIDALIDTIAEELEKLFEAGQFKPLRDALQQASERLKDKSVTLNCTLDIVDEDRSASLTLLNMGLSSHDGKEPHRCYGDSTSQRYLVDGEICQVPHDQCPECWENWDFKDKNRTCQSCGAQLGREVKILLDSDMCPHCEEGKVSVANPVCDKCGNVVDLDIAAWG